MTAAHHLSAEPTNASHDPDRHLRATPILDLHHRALAGLIRDRGWSDLPEFERIGAIYAFVRDEIGFGYNPDDDMAASAVLADGYGQCNTKATLLMALLRGAGVPCRFHGATIHKRLQQGVVTGLFYRIAPEEILHSWVEVRVGDRWVRLEGVICDADYLDGLRATFPHRRREFLGYGVGTGDLTDPPIHWRGEDTAIQMTGLHRDLGVFDDPDAFYAEVGTNLAGVKGLLYRTVIRHLMNRRVGSIRACRLNDAATPLAAAR